MNVGGGGVRVGGIGVLVGVRVGGIGVLVGVRVGGSGVLVGGIRVLVGKEVFVKVGYQIIVLVAVGLPVSVGVAAWVKLAKTVLDEANKGVTLNFGVP